MIVHIEKRKELNTYFDKYARQGFSARPSAEGRSVHIKFDAKPDIELVVPFIDIVFYAGFLPARRVV